MSFLQYYGNKEALQTETNQKPNRLIREKSPYLLQHAYNPVDWYPWGEEAFQRAKREDKPIFLSIGYSTCHWCHVMAHESFEDEEVAELLNAHFVAIKVDREERPDIDAVYMAVCQALTGHGGWPLNVFLTPEKKPFYAGTYFPKESRYGQPGFINILKTIANQYKKDKKKLEDTGERIATALSAASGAPASIRPDAVERCVEHFNETFDALYGGFGIAPKFPAPHQLMFLLRYAHLNGNDRSLRMVEKTLEGIADGGIHDHIGGGFARYSVDEKWLIPHFEKMLYDQAMLMLAYTEAWQMTGNARFRDVVADIFAYVTRDMRDADGGFYSAEDADSEGEEGRFYLWTPDEIRAVLGEDGDLYCRIFDITEEGNFEGRSLPNLVGRSLARIAAEEGVSLEALKAAITAWNRKLREARGRRVRPHKDDKILTSWNALMIAALATAARVFQNAEYLRAAETAFRFLTRRMMNGDELYARYRDGEVGIPGFLDDYAYFMWACDALYDATFDGSYIEKMRWAADRMIERFWDDDAFGFYLNNRSDLFMRPKEVYDGAVPSGNSVAAYELLRFSRRTGEIDYERYVDHMFNAFGDEVDRYPMGYAWLLSAFMIARAGTKELAVVTETMDGAKEKLGALQSAFLPEVVTLVGDRARLNRLASFTAGFNTENGETTYYLCEHFRCRRPMTDLTAIYEALGLAHNH